MKLFILRHFQRYDRPDFYTLLTMEGQKNAQLYVDKLLKLGITHIYASPYLRVLQTVQPFAYARRPMPIRVDYLLSEMRWEETKDSNLHEYGIDDIPLKFHEYIDPEYDSGSILKVVKAETFDDVIARSAKFVEKLRKMHNDSDRILVVTHSSVLNSFKQFTDDELNDDVHEYGKILEIDC